MSHDNLPTEDNSAPKAWITHPADSAVVLMPDTLRVTATDEAGVVFVRAYSGADTLGAGASEPHAFPFDTTIIAPDTLSLSASAWDAAGNVGHTDTITVFVAPDGTDVTAPVVTITSPADGAFHEEPDTLRIEASDDVGVILVTAHESGDSLGVDASEPYAIPIGPPGLGPDTLRIVASARDAAGNLGLSDTLTLIVPYEDLVPPTVTILAPQDSAEVEESELVEIFAGDNDSLASVWLFVDADSLPVDGPPFEYVWSPDADGDWHTLLARARDAADNHADSDTVNVRVLPGDYDPPLPWAPAQGALLHEPALVEFRWAEHATATDYQFELASDAGFNSLIHGEVLADTELDYLAPPEGELYWRLRAGRARAVWGEWCETRHFFAGEVFDGELVAGYGSSRGRDLVVCDGGDLMLAGAHDGNLLLLKMAVTGELVWVDQYLQEYSNVYAHRILTREGGGWTAIARVGLSNWTTTAVLLDVAANGLELGRRQLDADFASPVGLAERSGNEVIALIEGSFYQTYRVVERVSAAGASVWRKQVGEGDSGTWQMGTNHRAHALLDDPAADQVIVLREDESWWDNDDSWTCDAGCEGRDALTGEIVWELDLLHGQTIQGNPDVVPRPALTAAHLADDGVLLCAGSQGDEALLVQVDPNRMDFTVTTLSGLEPALFHDMDRLSSGAVVLAGTRGDHLRNAVVLLCDVLGNVIWERILGEPWDADEFRGLVVLPGDDIAVVGSSETYGQQTGGSLWYRRLDMYGNDIAP